MDSSCSVDSLVERWQAGDGDAPRLIFERFAHHLVGLAQQQLAPQLAPRIDGEDIVQSAFRTFFRRAAAGSLKIEDAGHLWRLLVRITLLKAKAQGRFHAAGMRSVRAESRGSDDWLAEASARDPGPEDAALLIDEINALLAGCPSLHGEILGLRLEGHETAGIAERLNISQRTVQRVLKTLQSRMAERDLSILAE